MSARKVTKSSSNSKECERNSRDETKAAIEEIPEITNLNSRDNITKRTCVQSVVEEGGYIPLRSISFSKSLPKSLQIIRRKDCTTRLLTLNEHHLERRERSKVFANPRSWHEQPSPPEHRFPNSKGHESDINNYERFSPRITRSLTYHDPVELFKQLYGIREAEVMFGRVKIMFQYFNKDKEFHLALLRVSNVANGIALPLRVYAKIHLLPGNGQKKICRHKYNSNNPVLNEQFHFQIKLGKLMESRIGIQFYNKPGIFSIPKPLGMCIINLCNFDLTTVTVMWEDLRKNDC